MWLSSRTARVLRLYCFSKLVTKLWIAWKNIEIIVTESNFSRNVAQWAFMSWVISSANKWEDYSNYSGEGVEMSRSWATAHFLVFWWCLGTVLVPLGVSLSLLPEDQGPVEVDLSAILNPSDSNWLMWYPWSMSLSTFNCHLIQRFGGGLYMKKLGTSLIAEWVKNPPAMQKTLVLFLGWEDLLEKG